MNLPQADFFQGDFLEQDFEENSFDAIVSFYAIFHIPRDKQIKLFRKIRKWVKNDGAILVTLGNFDKENLEGEIGGAEMNWSSYPAEKNVELVEESGFKIIETYIESWRDESHLWVLAET